MKQCPTCGHRTNDDVCPVCGAATVVLQNDPQEKAQRTIQYQRFDPSKAPGAAASGQAVQTGHRYIQKDPGATHQMQQGAGMIPPQRNQQPHPANQPPQSSRSTDQQQTAETARRAQQANADSSRNITCQHTDGFHPTTLPRRSQKYRQKYATYMPAEPTGADPAGSGVPTEPVVSKPSDSGVPAETVVSKPSSSEIPTEPVVPQPAEEIGAKIPAGMEPQQAPPADHAEPAVADPVEADGRHIQQANPITEEAAPGSEPATAHGLLSPEELEEFLDNQPDDAENEEFSAAPAKNEHTADTMSTVSDGLNEPVEAKSDIPVASAPGNAIKAEDRAAEHPGNAIKTENRAAEHPGNANEAADRAAEHPGNAIKAEDGPEEEHLPTRQELVQKHNAQIRRENNRRYAQEHASRATRRWQEESEQEPFAIVRGTCYYSALESENTVRGNFSKKRYKDDVLPQTEPVSYEDSEWYQGFEDADDPWGDYIEPGEKKEGVSHKTWFVILFLILFWPVGLILMWARKKFPLAVRIIITLIIAAGLAAEGFFLYKYGPAMYEIYMYGDNNNITYETPDSDSGSQSGSQTAAATENQQKALDKANEYVDTLPLSHDGLIKQLEYDGYTTDVATYAADNCSANWNKEAKEMAEQYMDSTTYTYKEMVQQLEAEGFTKKQAKFGAKAVGLE
ncbi:MAG: Ltp family lipoprotein [Clostridia bacterium]